MIPSTEEGFKKAKELADRNIANGDWGDETTIPGLPEGTTPMTPDERVAKSAASRILAKKGRRRLLKRKK